MLASTGEILAALSKALDMVEGQPAGHAFRTSRIACRIATILGLPERTITNVFFASLIKDSGCSNNSVRIHKIFGGDELLKKQAVKLVDWSNSVESIKYALSHIEWGDSVAEKLKKFASIIGPPTKIMNEVTEARCTRGAAIALELGFELEVAAAIQALDEHWDGKGSPTGMKRDRIPLLAQILCISQTMEVFLSTFGVEATKVMVTERRGRWFSPEISRCALEALQNEAFWVDHFAHMNGQTVPFPIDAENLARDTSLDTVCRCFAQIVDAKSTFTGEHSTRVTAYAMDIANYFQFERDRLKSLEHAALLHDIGKLGVSNSILEKPGRLTEDEFAQVKKHPYFSTMILSQIRGLERVTEIASAHHERLDGKGYWQGRTADQLDLDMRILTVSDVFDALTAKRPYRDPMTKEDAISLMMRDEGTAFDPECLRALEHCQLRDANGDLLRAA
ncbi:MAG: HD domain-containing protein [Armatimonadetes bacterium]|nr:HD domain-containing protein [Armatimonadota bacterium]